MMRLAWVAPCAALFVLLSGDVSARNWALGCALGVACVPLFPQSAALSSFHALCRLACLPWFLVGAVHQILGGAATVGLRLLTRQRHAASAIVLVENPARTRAAAHLLSLVFTASPGTVVLKFDELQNVLVVHVFDEQVGASAQQSFHRFYRRFQRWSFP